MERKSLEVYRELFKENFVGLEELNSFFKHMGFPVSAIEKIEIPEISFSIDELQKYSKGYILILGIGSIDGQDLSIRFMRDKFGIDPDVYTPCFYNQDWYMQENFINTTLENKWYLIKKDVFENARAIQPIELIKKGINFPSAILSTYTFFAYYFCYEEFLWKHDFLWCSDLDHNEDRVYVGKYEDVDGINKNGFSIHRHLALRPCYSAIESL